MYVLSSFCPVISINRLLATGHIRLSTFRSEPSTALKRSHVPPQSDDPTYTQAIPLPHRSTAYRRDLAGQVIKPYYPNHLPSPGKDRGEVDRPVGLEVNNDATSRLKTTRFH